MATIQALRFETPQYGEEAYREALRKYDAFTGRYGDLIDKSMGQIGELAEFYKPGGGYGTGQRTEARETIGKGVAKTTGQMVASGMSSLVGTRGINVLAASELTKRFQGIEESRAGLQMQAFGPYTQMLSQLQQLASQAPKRGQYITPGKPGISAVETIKY